jgi:hypothetical protein
LLSDALWRRAHCNSARDFSRDRQINFTTTLLLVLQKSAKSIQLHLNEFFAVLHPESSNNPTPSAWTQARSKLNPSAFVSLNQKAMLEEFYQPDNPQLNWCGHRLLATDGSEVYLPDSEEMGDYFGRINARNQRGPCGEPYILGRVSVLFDVKNHLVLDGVLSRYTVGEIALAEQHLAHAQTADVILYDRGYCGFEWLARHHLRGRHYICRVPRASFAAAETLFTDNVAGVSCRVWLKASSGQRHRLRSLGLPLEIEVRLVTFGLPIGELEVLATSLLDEAMYSASDFGEAYRCRWGVEPFYGLIKGRLGLENFSGRTVESVIQDFQATLLITNLESVLCREPQEELQAGRPPEQLSVAVNHAVSFNALKNRILALLSRQNQPVAEVLDKLRHLFHGNPVRQRPGRKVPRRPENPRRGV